MADYSKYTAFIRRRDRFQCCYCGRRDLFGEFDLDHFLPKARYPALVEDRENIVLACHPCNCAKGGFDPTGLILNPRKDDYTDHLALQQNGVLVAKSDIGRSTLEVLQLNRPSLVSWRQQEERLRETLASLLKTLSGIDGLDELLAGGTGAEEDTADKRAWILDLYQRLSDLAGPPTVLDEVGRVALVQAIDWTQVGKELTPYVMAHLGSSPYDLEAIDPYLFEKVIAEYFASIRCKVTLLGQNPRTGADMLAVRADDPVGVEIRYMIEVKRWKTRVGIEVIDRVLGTFTREKPEYGWDKMLIISRAGFKDFRGTDEERLKCLGIHLKGTSDIAAYLRAYKPRPDGGLWLPQGWNAQGNA